MTYKILTARATKGTVVKQDRMRLAMFRANTGSCCTKVLYKVMIGGCWSGYGRVQEKSEDSYDLDVLSLC